MQPNPEPSATAPARASEAGRSGLMPQPIGWPIWIGIVADDLDAARQSPVRPNRHRLIHHDPAGT